MVDHVDHLIAYAWHLTSNARKLAEYGERCAVFIIRLCSGKNYEKSPQPADKMESKGVERILGVKKDKPDHLGKYIFT